MTAEERQQIIDHLTADFRSAKESNCQNPSTWMGLAERYQSIAANMNWAYCIGRAVACHQMVEMAPVPVAVETG